MLNKEQMEELRNSVDRVDLTKAIQDAKDMGIEVTKKYLGYHGMYILRSILYIVNNNVSIDYNLGKIEWKEIKKEIIYNYNYFML